MKITFLGTGNAFAPQRAWASVLINESILLDAAPSALMSLKHLGLDPAGIRHIFISHFHGDHCFGLPFLLLDNFFISRTAAPLAIIGPPGIEEYTRQLMNIAYPDIAERGWPRPITFTEANVNVEQVADGLSFSTFHMLHGAGILTAFGYRIALEDGKLAYSGDTAMTDVLYSLIEGTAACILEATSQDDHPIHLGRNAIRQIIERAPNNCRILLNHLDTPDAKAWQDLDVIVPRDFQTFEL